MKAVLWALVLLISSGVVIGQEMTPQEVWERGRAYENGDGVEKDLTKSVEWYQLAADMGHVRACYDLGWAYEKGWGMPIDVPEAVQFYLKAADQGNAESQYRLGYLYGNGIGGPQDIFKAASWYRKAAEQGHEDAKKELEKLGYSLAAPSLQQTSVDAQQDSNSWTTQLTDPGGAPGKQWVPDSSLSPSGDKWSDSDILSLLGEMVAFRVNAATDFTATLNTLPGREHLGFLLNTDAGREMPLCWSYFFAGSFILIGATNSPQPVVGFLNPYLDGILLTRWSRSPESEIRLESAAISWASGLGTPGMRANSWLKNSADRSLPTVLQEKMWIATRTFQNLWPGNAEQGKLIAPDSISAATASAIGFESALLLQSLVRGQMTSRPEYRSSLRRLKNALASDDPSALPGICKDSAIPAASALWKLPLDARAALIPFLLLPADQDALVLFHNPNLPRFVLIAALRENSRTPVSALALFDILAKTDSFNWPLESPAEEAETNSFNWLHEEIAEEGVPE